MQSDLIPREEPDWLDLPSIAHPFGILSFGQNGQPFPFALERIYFVCDIPAHAVRGGHAHRSGQEAVFCLQGSFTLWMFSADGRSHCFRLDNPRRGVYVPPCWWVELGEYSPGAITLVVASNLYQEADYIRDTEAFFRGGPLPHPVSRPRG